MLIRRISMSLGLAASSFLLASWASAQTYGPNDQILTIGAAEFHPTSSTQVTSFNLGDFYIGGSGDYLAAVRLPDGAEITQMCVYSYDPDSSGTSVAIFAMKLPAGGQAPGAVLVPGSLVNESFNIGYGTICTDPMSFTVLSDADLDGMGSEHLTYVVNATLGTNAALGGVRITWHRQVSAAPATATFADVPVGAFGFQQIEALAASGITGGCGGGNYCPGQSLTRAQMAIFLAKALGLYWGN